MKYCNVTFIQRSSIQTKPKINLTEIINTSAITRMTNRAHPYINVILKHLSIKFEWMELKLDVASYTLKIQHDSLWREHHLSLLRISMAKDRFFYYLFTLLYLSFLIQCSCFSALHGNHLIFLLSCGIQHLYSCSCLKLWQFGLFHFH